jgi:membrane protease YdiL (CAAX protease family)
LLLHKSKITDQESSLSLFGVLPLALALFIPLFLTQGIGPFDFWWWMTTNLLVLLAVVSSVDVPWRRALAGDLRNSLAHKAVLGILSALVLYGVFWFGDKASRFLLAGAAHDISAVYAFKGQAPALRIALLMIFVIGPGEELFWRGFLQRRLEGALGGPFGWLAATAVYAAIHLATGNWILVLAAGVCGAFWGLLYLRYRSMVLNAVSHTIWDIVIFLLLPLG